jgi:nicotinamide-nucleotide amidase
MFMNRAASIISIGSELTSGQNLDTNSRWLSGRLSEIGVPTHAHLTIGDDLVAIVDAIAHAARHSAVILVTGGLGPTQDDLTREAVAAWAGVVLIEDAASLAAIQALFARRNRDMPERNRVQALVPAGAEVLANPIGTAPGIAITHGSATLFAMPGVPVEMNRMYADEVLPRLVAMGLGSAVTIERQIHCFGAGESAVEAKLLDLTRRDAVPEVGITVSDAVITLRIRATAKSAAECESMIAPVEATIRERLGDWVFGSDGQSIAEVTMKRLMNCGATVATAESITAGLVANMLAETPGASQHLLGGIVAYTNAVKARDLMIDERLIAEHTAVSDAVVRAMAEGARAHFHSDYAVATTGYAGPTGGDDGTPVGTVFVAVAHASGTIVERFTWGGTRREIQSRTARLAMNLLRLSITDPDAV